MNLGVSSLGFRVGPAHHRGRGVTGHLSPATCHSTAAFSLVECLVYIAIFAVFIVLAMQAFFAGRDGSDRLTRSADDLTRAIHAGERWREDVRTATAAPRVVTESGQTWLVLPHGSNVVVYTHFKDTLWRQANTNAPWQPALARVKASRMDPDARAHVTAWRWELELAVKDERQRTRPRFTFLAAATAAKLENQP